MKWNLISTSLSGIKEYHLLKNDRLLLVMKYSQEQQSVRITLDKEHLIFLLENNAGGLIAGERIHYMNAYGVDLGKFSFNPRNRSGQLQIDDRVFQYATINDPQPSLLVYKKTKEHPLAVCAWPLASEQPPGPIEYACLVLGVCWSLQGVPA